MKASHPPHPSSLFYILVFVIQFVIVITIVSLVGSVHQIEVELVNRDFFLITVSMMSSQGNKYGLEQLRVRTSTDVITCHFFSTEVKFQDILHYEVVITIPLFLNLARRLKYWPLIGCQKLCHWNTLRAQPPLFSCELATYVISPLHSTPDRVQL